MTVAETLELARFYNVEVRLNSAGDGLNLEVEADPPQALMNVLRRTKWDIVAALRQHEIDRRRPLIARWINDHFFSTPPNICRHCGKGAQEDDIFVRLYCGDDSGDVHASCQPAWREAEEARASTALGLGLLTRLFDRHFPLLYDIEEARPHDVGDAQWDVAMRGLRTFLATGGADEALRLGWTKGELFRVPTVWARGDLCGVGLLIGDREVVEVKPAEIRIKTASAVTQSFRRRPEPDFGLVYAERAKLLVRDVDEDEARARAFEFTVGTYRAHYGCDLETAKRAVLAAMKRGASPTRSSSSSASTPPAAPAMTFYEFFCGGGMARAGLGHGWTCWLANDIDPKKSAAYAANWGDQGLRIGDVGCLTPADLPGVTDLVWASPPCQDVSLAGDRAGLAGTRSGAFWPFWKLMQGLRAEGRAPRLIVAENVTGLLTSHEGKDFDAICAALTDANYRFGAVVIDAALFVPQSRERVFIVAVGTDAHIPAELVADGPTAPFHSSAIIAACQRQRNPIWWRLPIPPARNTTLADTVEDEPQGVRWNTQAYTDWIVRMMAPKHLARVEAAKRAGKRVVRGLHRRTRGKGDKKRSAWEVRFDGLAGCLRMPTGGSSIQTIVIVDGDIVRTRRLSVREAARLMGLSDDYLLPSNYNDAYGLMGDGVVVPVVRFLAEHILQPVLRAQRDQGGNSAKPIAAHAV